MPAEPMENVAYFRFYEELNDFLPDDREKRTITYHFDGNPGIKDSIEALGVPHPEVDLVVVNGESVGFEYQLRDQDRVAVYPVFECFDISPIVRLRPEPLRESRFILDVHLGKLARYLRLLGFDAEYRNDYTDSQIVAQAAREKRIILTRDRAVLFYNIVTHGYWVRSTDPETQLRKVVDQFDLYSQIEPYIRCSACNGLIHKVDKEDVIDQLQSRTKRYFNDFKQCSGCGRVYWQGSHCKRIAELIASVRGYPKDRKYN